MIDVFMSFLLQFSLWLLLFMLIFAAFAGNTPISVIDTSFASQNVSNSAETYIVLLKDQISAAEMSELEIAVESRGGNIIREYAQSIKGFAVQFPEDKKSEIMNVLKSDNNVISIEFDRLVRLPPPLSP